MLDMIGNSLEVNAILGVLVVNISNDLCPAAQLRRHGGGVAQPAGVEDQRYLFDGEFPGARVSRRTMMR